MIANVSDGLKIESALCEGCAQRPGFCAVCLSGFSVQPSVRSVKSGLYFRPAF